MINEQGDFLSVNECFKVKGLVEALFLQPFRFGGGEKKAEVLVGKAILEVSPRSQSR